MINKCLKQTQLYMTTWNNGEDNKALSITHACQAHSCQTYFALVVLFKISAGFRFQFLRDPLISPAITTNSSTSTLMQVNTLFTIADSFTPNASNPKHKTTLNTCPQKHKQGEICVYQVKEILFYIFISRRSIFGI